MFFTLSVLLCFCLFIQLSPFPCFISPVCVLRDSDLADADWKGDGHCEDPQIPSQASRSFLMLFSPPHSFFFSPDWLSSDLLFLSALSHQESHLPEPIFPSLGAHLQHECGKLPFHKLSLHRLRLSQHFHWPFIGNYAYKRLLMQIQLRWGRSSGGSFLFCFFNVYNDSCFIFKPSFISADASSEVRASVNPL